VTPQRKGPSTLAGAAEARIIDSVRTLRRACWENGYRPVAIWSHGAENDKGEPIVSAGKRPVGHDWRQKALRDPPAAVTGAVSRSAPNTGILADQLAAVDIDVPVQPLADKIVHRIERRLGPTPLVRIGRAPKILLVYRRETPHPKLIIPELYLPDGSEDRIKVQVEVLGEGQQFVADGIHPDTRKPYTWTDGSPADTPIVDLPIVTEDMLRDMLEEVEWLLREAGAVEKEKPPRRPSRDPSQGGSDFFRNVNTVALANIERWVKELFPTAQQQPATGAWRVSSTDLGRRFEEDLSIHPEGIQDFGTEETLTPIDVAIRHGGKANAIEAALWLCDRLGFASESLGWGSGGTPPPGIAKPGTEGVTFDDFYAYMPQHKYIYAPSRELWPPESINGRLPKVFCGCDKSGDPIYVSPAHWLDRNRPVEQMTWAPGLPMIIPNRLISEGGLIARQNVSCFNLYLPTTLPLGDPSQAGPWLDHIWQIYPDHADHLLSWFAHRVQRPQEKCNHAVILGGPPGIGKDSLLEPVKRAIGPWNFREASPTQAMGRFNSFLKAVILRISEAKDLGETDRFKFYEHMKTYIAAPPDVLRCDEKNLREHAIINCCGVAYTTNYKAEGIYLPADDRRHYVAWSSFKKEDFSE
jgi:Bifunctional DNA primase/polymerase, N-terminal